MVLSKLGHDFTHVCRRTAGLGGVLDRRSSRLCLAGEHCSKARKMIELGHLWRSGSTESGRLDWTRDLSEKPSKVWIEH